MSDKGFTVRFRKKLDDDLREATRGLSEGSLSDLARSGLRIMLGIRTTKQVEIREKQIIIPQAKEKTVQVHGQPAVYLPKRN